jgi:hypothetical protein
MDPKEQFAKGYEVLTSLPGLTEVSAGLGIVPGYEQLAGGLRIALGVSAILILVGRRRELQRIPSGRAWGMVAAISGAVILALWAYRTAYQQCVLPYRDGVTETNVLFPIFVAGPSKLARLIDHYGGRNQVLNYLGPSEVLDLIQAQPFGAATAGVTLLVLHLLVETALVILLVGAAIRWRANGPSTRETI